MDAIRFIVLFWCLFFGMQAAHANGQLDSSFAGGKVSSFWPTDASSVRGATRAIKTLVQADGKVLVISNTPTPFGSQFSGNSQIGIIRLNVNGSLDASYGSGGQRLLDAGIDFEVEATDASLRADGALLVLGTMSSAFVERSDMAVWAVLPSGQADPAFANGGLLRIRRGGAPTDTAGAIVPYTLYSNVFLIAGGVRDGTVSNHGLMQVILFADTGKLCGVTSCGNVVGGNVGMPDEWRMFRQPFSFDVQVTDLVAYLQPSTAMRIRTLLRRGPLDAQGEFDGIVFGTSYTSKSSVLGVDSDFGSGGVRLFFFSAAPGYRHNTANKMAVQMVGGSPRLVIVGYVADAQDLDPSMGVYAMDLISGSGDSSFINAGLGQVFDYSAGQIHGDAYANDVLVTPDNKILIGGGYEYAGFSFGDAGLLRLNQNGSFDPSFGNLSASLPGRMGYGHFLLGSDRDNRLDSMALTPDGEKVVFSGYAYSSDDGSYYASTMRARLYAFDLLRNGFE